MLFIKCGAHSVPGLYFDLTNNVAKNYEDPITSASHPIYSNYLVCKSPTSRFNVNCFEHHTISKSLDALNGAVAKFVWMCKRVNNGKKVIASSMYFDHFSAYKIWNHHLNEMSWPQYLYYRFRYIKNKENGRPGSNFFICELHVNWNIEDFFNNASKKQSYKNHYKNESMNIVNLNWNTTEGLFKNISKSLRWKPFEDAWRETQLCSILLSQKEWKCEGTIQDIWKKGMCILLLYYLYYIKCFMILIF